MSLYLDPIATTKVNYQLARCRSITPTACATIGDTYHRITVRNSVTGTATTREGH